MCVTLTMTTTTSDRKCFHFYKWCNNNKNNVFSWELHFFLDVMNTICRAEIANDPTIIQQARLRLVNQSQAKNTSVCFLLSKMYNKSMYCAVFLTGKPGQMIFQLDKLQSLSIQTHCVKPSQNKD